ncbi:Do family serine endopeptidase [Xenorhabdus nematophila]|uniref:peptidase Do n=1 Tax=Xenorhabdus nematophila (strain ATCC 19061 / DSM 3370 / CCUG 14189 / LMG 1036 / NCIMB 9965 / AN6) TaxID=406817 RepID=D3VDG5_XENNA|nr:serine endoprotease DegQ [Xenorhabdus nematophila]CEE92051.1 serine endoprotease [Xenorhabdus nematophila str. Anatoliense]CEF32091.1 serine endoprotease [Xenorhabdus nematophila str. Websteri]AYA42014.1 Do family serine endopeptidase [Xenorhabdus nematophila]KHD28345.1 serine endoprotease DegQ [Xenorhabdus nematophila]MBA0020737.1 Do family serine endopeptidase [Xenorhabdus nematophila]
MNRKNTLLSALAISIGLSLASVPMVSNAALPAAMASQELPSLAPMLEKVLPSVVTVHVSGTEVQNQQLQLPEDFQFFFGPGFPQQEQRSRPFKGLGSGVIIDAEKGYVLTNSHVIENANKMRVQLNDGREYSAKLIGRDPQSDIALLQLSNTKNLTAIKFADSDQLRIGDYAVAIGNPFGLGQTVTSGIISALGRSGLNLEGLENFIQTDASINRGNSGGALINLKGELIGINTAIIAPSGGNVGIGFAIPSNMAKNLAAQLIASGEVKRGILGIKGTEMTADIAQALNVDAQQGAFVSEVIPKSAAAKAGIKPGDVLVSFDGKKISSFAELRAKIGTTAPGKEIKIGLLRKGRPLTVAVTLDNSDGNATNAEQLSIALQGATLSNSTVKETQGIKVDSIMQNSPAALSGLQKDDLIVGANNTRVRNIHELRKIVENKPSVIALNILRGDDNVYLLLRN